MSRSAAALIFALLTASLALSGCLPSHSFVLRGDEKSVDVTFSGDVAKATEAARQHCAEYGRVPRLFDRGFDVATFDCVRP